MFRQFARRRLFSHQALAFILLLLFIGVELFVFVVSDTITVQSRMVGVGVIFLIIALALFDNLFEVSAKSQAWQQLAGQTGLDCKTGNFLLGYSVQVSGAYRGWPLLLYTHKRGKGQVASTRIELTVKNEAKAVLRLRGPFNKDQATADKVTGDLFGAAHAGLFGMDRRFFIRSEPIHLATGIFRAGPLKERLLELRPLANIELEKQTLSFEQLGTVTDVAYLQDVMDLLSDLADAIERGGYAKLAKVTAAAK